MDECNCEQSLALKKENQELRTRVERLENAIREHKEALTPGEDPTKYDFALWSMLGRK